MIAEFGHYALVLALALALVQSFVPVWGARTRDQRLMSTAGPVAMAQFLFVALAYAALTWGYLTADFSISNVAENSNSAQPLIYRISGVWGNHEGSMLLWVLILVFFGALVSAFGNNLPLTLKATTLSVQSWVASAFLAFVLFTSNPFGRLSPAPFEGRELNPLLQDPGLAIHPPLLYLGYVGCSISFAFSVAALIDGRIDAAWARWVRPWTLAAWIFLTLGIAMGSYWAYYELGWGGWWFWDPVENASLMPWLAATALLHSAIVMEKREALKVWTVLLAILAFSLSLLGTFLVRSGVLTSVHAFAVDPKRGVFILAILIAFIGGSLALFAWRASSLRQGGLFAPISREGALVLNNLFLTAATATVLVGTLYPLLVEAFSDGKISVGAPFFNATFGPLAIPLLIAMPFGPLLAWKRGDMTGAAQRLIGAFALALVAMGGTFALKQGGPVLAPFLIGLAVFVVMGALVDLIERAGFGRLPMSTAVARMRGLPRSALGTVTAHLGVGLTLFGIVGETFWKDERILSLRPGQSLEIAGYSLSFEGMTPQKGPNYRETVGHFRVLMDGKEVGLLNPSKRIFTGRGMPTSEAALLTRNVFSQLYISMGDPGEDGSVAIRAYYKPLVLLIWIGCLVMAFGGLLSLSDRRLRIGAPVPARKSRLAAQPAE